MSREEILEYVKYFTGTFAVIGIVSAIVFGIAGVYIGKLILRSGKTVDDYEIVEAGFVKPVMSKSL